MEKILYGAAYYHENMPFDRIDEDIRLMKAAGLSVVRIGESSWGKFEPEEGVFEFEWMDRIVKKMKEADIKVIMGTPTYSIPTWMAAKYPEVIASKLKGEKHYYGVRQNMDILNPKFLFFAERIVRKIAERYSKFDNVIGFQVDNETTCNEANTKYFQQGFIKHLQNKFVTTDSLNKAWGLAYWGMQVNNWDYMPTRDGTTNPSYKLEWDRFCRKTASEYLKWQTKIVGEYKRENQFVTHCFNMIWIYPNAQLNQVDISKDMEVASLNVYHDIQEGMEGHGIAIGGDFTRSFKKGNYLVTETNAQASDFGSASSQNPPFDGQFRLNAWHHIATGANMVEYWHWHSNHNGNEMFWRGILSHDLNPNRLYKEFQQTANEINRLSPKIVNHQKESKVALLYSSDSHFGNPTMNPGFSYDWELLRMHKSLYKNNIATDFTYPESNDWSKYKLIVIPSLYVSSNQLLIKIKDYVAKGGNVIFGPRSGYCNEFSGARYTSQPGELTELCGVYYQEMSKINKLELASNPYQIDGEHNKIETWLEYLIPTTARPLFFANHTEFGKYPAVVENSFGKGTAIYQGSILTDQLQEAIILDKCKKLGFYDPESSPKFPIIYKQSKNSKNKTIHFYLNYSDRHQTIKYTYENGVNLINNKILTKNKFIELKPWDVAIIEQ